MLFSDLIVREVTEGSLSTDPRASDMAAASKHRLFSSSAKLLFTGPYPPPISGVKTAHRFDCELASPNGADS